MADPRGEVTFEAGGKKYSLKLGTYALAILERATKMPSSRFFKRDDDDWGADDVLRVFYAGLYQKHKLSEEEVGAVIDNLGMAQASAILIEALGVSAAPEGTVNGDGDEDPPPQAGANDTGTTS